MKNVLTPYQNREYELSELESAARELLRQCGPGIGDERVALFPDTRTLRYYQSLGIMNRPVRYDSRTAIYGYRSLLQAICVKLLQSRGFSLAQVQNALTGATAAKLESAVLEAMAVGPSAELIHPPPAPTPSDPTAPGPMPGPFPMPGPERAASLMPRPCLLVSVEVVPGVVVTVDPRKIANPEAIIRHVAETLSHNFFARSGDLS